MAENSSNETYDMAELVTSSQSDVRQETTQNEQSSEDKKSEYDINNSSLASKATPTPKRKLLRKKIVYKEEDSEEGEEFSSDSFSSSSEKNTKAKKKVTKIKTSTTKKQPKKTSKQPGETKINFCESEVLNRLIKEHKLGGETLQIFLVFYNSNRPSSQTELSLSFSKKILEASLRELVEKKLIVCKLYNKTKMYMMNTVVCDYEDLEVLEDRLTTHKEKSTGLKKELSTYQGHFSTLQNQLTNEELDKKIEELMFQIEQNKTNILKIKTGELCKEDEINQINSKLKKYLKIEKERKSILSNIVDIVSEKLDLKRNEFYEEVGLEYD